jgi:hypothetical protein
VPLIGYFIVHAFTQLSVVTFLVRSMLSLDAGSTRVRITLYKESQQHATAAAHRAWFAYRTWFIR